MDQALELCFQDMQLIHVCDKWYTLFYLKRFATISYNYFSHQSHAKPAFPVLCTWCTHILSERRIPSNLDIGKAKAIVFEIRSVSAVETGFSAFKLFRKKNNL